MASATSLSSAESSKLLQLLGYLRSVSHPGWDFVPWSDVDEACALLQLDSSDIAKLPRSRGGVDLKPLQEWAEANAFCGVATDSKGSSLDNVIVESSGCKVVTGSDGTFRVPRGPVTLRKEGYVNGYYPHMLGPLMAVMHDVGVFARIDANVGGMVTDAVTGASLYVLPGSLARKDGSIFEGEASVSLSVIDATKPEDLAAMPGAFKGRALNGSEVQMASLGAAHVGATDVASGEPLQVTAGEELTLTLPSAAAVDLEVLDEAPSLWSFDDKSGVWVQESVPLIVDGVELPAPGTPLAGAVRASGTGIDQQDKTLVMPSVCKTDGGSVFWRSDCPTFDWAVDGVASTGEDCGSGFASDCVWAALARLCALEGYEHLTAEALQVEAKISSRAALPFTHGESHAVLQDILADGPVSLEALRSLCLPSLKPIALRALEVHHGRVQCVHYINGSTAPSYVSACILLEVNSHSAHALLLHLPQDLHDSDCFQQFVQQLLPKTPEAPTSFVRYSGKKAKKSSDRDVFVSMSRGGQITNPLGVGMSKESLQALLKDKRTLSLRLKSMGWWNADAPLPRLAMLVGKLVDSDGYPLPAVQLVAKASNYAGWSYAVSDPMGAFQFICAVGSHFVVDAYWKVPQQAPDYSDSHYLAQVRASFAVFDRNEDGVIDREELRLTLIRHDLKGLLAQPLSMDKLMASMCQNNGCVNLDGFMTYLASPNREQLTSDFRAVVDKLLPGVVIKRVALDVQTPEAVGDSVDVGARMLGL